SFHWVHALLVWVFKGCDGQLSLIRKNMNFGFDATLRNWKAFCESHSRAMAVVVAVIARGGGYRGGGGDGDGACYSCGGRYNGGGGGGSCNNCWYFGLLQGTAQQALAEKLEWGSGGGGKGLIGLGLGSRQRSITELLQIGEAGRAYIGVLDLLIKATSGLVMLSMFLNLLHQQV
ncbi:hypothetical protein HN873_036352, partial [Arachis hypogaea]